MLSARRARGTTVNKPDSQITLPGFRNNKMGLTTMEAKYNEIYLFQHWRKMATSYSTKKFFQQEGATPLKQISVFSIRTSPRS